jgi:rhamnose transport system permease protein
MRRVFRHPEALLALALAIEVILFSQTAEHFATAGNFLEVLRLTADVGLLALAMSPVILTGGIDLSAGSMLGLCAITFGKLWRDGHWSPGWAAVGAILTGALGGGLNALLINRLRLPPLIVTLGSFSLFRGLAEAITQGVDNFTGFPAGFLFLGQGYFFGVIPAQAPVFALAAIGFWLLVHATVFGRSFRAIGFAPEGARYAGLPVERRVGLVYVLSGATSGVAALLYTAHLGQAKADAGTGYELLAITAVVLGGTSIFGGTGSVHGTLLGLAVLAILRNGLTLSDQPAELSGILTGTLLLAVLLAEAAVKKLGERGWSRRSRRVEKSLPGAN